MARIVLRGLLACDVRDGATVALDPGDPIENYQIHRNSLPDANGDVYVMAFESRGRKLRSPLAQFQARTASTQAASVEQHPAREAAAIPIADSGARAGSHA